MGDTQGSTGVTLARARRDRLVLYVMFIASGAAGLVYELTWAGLLSQLVGGTTATHSVVLAAFMGGLALGNRFGGRWADGDTSPLKLYGLLEFAVGVLGVLSPQLADLAGMTYTALAPDLDGGMVWLDMPLKLALAAACILPGAFFMGGTLPALVRASTEALQGLGRSVGWLYFVNSAGATLGAFATGFWVLPTLGHEMALTAAGTTNLALALIALALSRGAAGAQTASDHAAASAAGDGAPARARAYSAAQVNAALTAVFISGTATMMIEIVWTRLLTLTLGGSAHAFAIMLGTFIAGIALGGIVAARAARDDRDAFRPLLVAEATAALSLLLLMPLYDRLPYVFWSGARVLQPGEDTYGIYLGISTSVAVLAMFIPTLAMGATLPLASRVATPALGQAGRKVGGVFSVNTLGNVIGSMVGGLLLVPAVGIETTMRIGAAILLLAAGRVLWTAVEPARRPVVVGGAAAVALALLVALPGWHPGLLHSGLYRSTDKDFGTFEEFYAGVQTVEFLMAEDDAEASVAVVRDPEGHRFLRVNGKSDASTRGDVPTQTMLGAAPLLFHPAPKRALVIGIGSGISVGAVVADPSLERIDAVEISPAVVNASQHFEDISGAPLSDPRVRLYETDARTVLRVPPGGFPGAEADGVWDVIVSQPSNPWQAGSAALFTGEYFELLRSRLRPGGIMSAWFHSYEIDDAGLETLLRTFGEVFPNPRLFNSTGNDFVVLATRDGAPADLDTLARRLQTPGLAQVLKRMLPGGQPLSLPTMLALEVLDPTTFEKLFARNDGAVLHLDRHPVLPYQGPKALFIGERSKILDQLDRRLEPLGEADLLLAQLRTGKPFEASEQDALADLFLRRGRPLDDALATALTLTRWLSAPEDPAVRRRLRALDAVDVLGQATFWDRESAAGGPQDASACRAWLHFEAGLVRDARSVFTAPAETRWATARDACLGRFEALRPLMAQFATRYGVSPGG